VAGNALKLASAAASSSGWRGLHFITGSLETCLLIKERSLDGLCYGAMAGFSRLCDVFVTWKGNGRVTDYSELFYMKCKDRELAGKTGSPNYPPLIFNDSLVPCE
jgi:hypothetical protein